VIDSLFVGKQDEQCSIFAAIVDTLRNFRHGIYTISGRESALSSPRCHISANMTWRTQRSYKESEHGHFTNLQKENKHQAFINILDKLKWQSVSAPGKLLF
jgi:hypothetical protein